MPRRSTIPVASRRTVVSSVALRAEEGAVLDWMKQTTGVTHSAALRQALLAYPPFKLAQQQLRRSRGKGVAL